MLPFFPQKNNKKTQKPSLKYNFSFIPVTISLMLSSADQLQPCLIYGSSYCNFVIVTVNILLWKTWLLLNADLLIFSDLIFLTIFSSFNIDMLWISVLYVWYKNITL